MARYKGKQKRWGRNNKKGRKGLLEVEKDIYYHRDFDKFYKSLGDTGFFEIPNDKTLRKKHFGDDADMSHITGRGYLP